jgi:4'-phosphopantetheinyl transferase EntD
MIELILPSDVQVAALRDYELDTSLSDLELFSEERLALGQVAPQRRLEFTAGRACAHQVLMQLGWQRLPILCGPHREPLWPAGLVGSITHCPGYCAAAIATNELYSSLGIDAELNAPLPAEVLPIVLSAEEQQVLVLPSIGIYWDRLLFSIKESVYKLRYPMEYTWLDFEDCHVEVLEDLISFQVRIHTHDAISALWRSELRGRFAFDEGHVVTAMTITAPSNEI